MKWEEILTHAPFAIPLSGLIAGIILSELDNSLWFSIILLVTGTILFLRFNTKKSRIYRQNSQRTLFIGISIFALFSSVGIIDSYFNKPIEYDFENQVFPPYAKGIVQERMEAESLSLRIKITGLSDMKETNVSIPEFDVLLSTDRSRLYPGDEVVFIHNLKRLDPGNNYNLHLINSGILYRQYIDSRDIIKTGTSRSIKSIAAECRRNLIGIIESSPLSRPAAYFLTAILLGDTSYIDNNGDADLLRDAGIGHILALSGLHVGIICSLIMFFLYPLKRLYKGKIRIIAALIILWSFAFISGLGATVVRASIMTSFYLTAIMLERKNSALNALFAAIFFILLFEPLQIYNAGLQLSAMTVGTLIVMSRHFQYSHRRRHPFLYRIYAAVATCMIATVGSMGLSIYYFHSLPIWSIPINLIIIPLLPIYFTCALIYLIILALDIQSSFMAFILDGGWDALDSIIKFFSSLTSLSMDIWISRGSLVIYYSLLFCLILLLKMKGNPRIYMSGVCAIMLTILVGSLLYFPGEKPADGFCFSNSPSDKMTVYSNGRSTDIALGNPDGHTSISSFGKTIIVADYKWKNMIGNVPSECDYLVIGRGFEDELSELLSCFRPKRHIVILRSLLYREEDIIGEAKAKGMEVWSLRKDGELEIPAQDNS